MRSRGLLRRRGGLALLVFALVVCLLAPLGRNAFAGRSSAPHATHGRKAFTASRAGRLPGVRKVAIVAMENRSYEQVIGNRHAPYINALAHRYALATHFYAEAHPSLPNWVALTGGSELGIHHDCSTCDTEATNFVNQLDGAGISWRAYFQSLPATGSTARAAYHYSAHLNPFVYFEHVADNPADRGRIQPFPSLASALATGRLPRVTWVAPDLVHDGHSASLARSDRYLARLVPQLIAGVGRHGVVYVVWDEGAPHDRRGLASTHGGGRIALLAAGALARPHGRVATPANHYALLRTLEASLRLRTLGRAGAPGTPLLGGLLTSGVRHHHQETSRPLRRPTSQ